MTLSHWACLELLSCNYKYFDLRMSKDFLNITIWDLRLLIYSKISGANNGVIGALAAESNVRFPLLDPGTGKLTV